MKKILLSALFIMTALCRLQAQDIETHVKVHCGETPLENLLTEEQKKSVTYLTVTGTLLDEDYAFLQENLYKQLATLNLRDTEIDTIPNIAPTHKHYNHGINLILPLEIKYINANFLMESFDYYSIEVTGKFPTFGEYLYQPPGYNSKEVSLSGDNPFYKMETFNFPEDDVSEPYSAIYSLNEDTFYYMNLSGSGEYAIKEGTKTINATAFRNNMLPDGFTLVLPASLDSIGDYSFENTFCPLPTNYVYKSYPIDRGHYGAHFICEAIEPPKLGKDAFKMSVLELSYLYVHEESIEKYKNAEGWNQAIEIRAIEKMGDNHVSTQGRNKNVSVVATPDAYELTFYQKPIYGKIYSTNGALLSKQPIESLTLSVDRNQLIAPYTIVRIYFANGTIESVKLIP